MISNMHGESGDSSRGEYCDSGVFICLGLIRRPGALLPLLMSCMALRNYPVALGNGAAPPDSLLKPFISSS